MNLFKDKKLEKFVILSVLGIILINLPLISAYILLVKFGTLTLNPGEKYTVNIPFIGQSKFPVICGTAEQTDGTLLEGINVTVKYYNYTAILAQNTTGKDGEFCITLPNITSSKKFDVYISYNNSTLTLGSSDYGLNFDNHKIYSKSSDGKISLTGTITNYDAEIENGRLEIKMGQMINGTPKYTFGDYYDYSLNIDANQEYDIPNDEIVLPWNVSDLNISQYKLLIKTSFNAKEHTKDIYFDITRNPKF